MARRSPKVAGEESSSPATEPHPATQLRGHGPGGSVRPADNRFLDPDEIAMRDAYVEEKTGPDAQQLIVKREAPEHVEALSSSGTEA